MFYMFFIVKNYTYFFNNIKPLFIYIYNFFYNFFYINIVYYINFIIYKFYYINTIMCILLYKFDFANFTI